MAGFRKRFGCCLVMLAIASTQASEFSHRFQSRLQTKYKINEALLQTRGGWFRRKSADPNATHMEEDIMETITPVELAAQLRESGKASHDQGNFTQAARQFHEAANLLEAQLLQQDDDATDGGLQEAWSTCRFHESLCRLKAEEYGGCIDACTSLLERGDDAANPIRARTFHRRAKAKAALGDVEGALIDARSAAFLGDRRAVAHYGTLLRESHSSSGGWEGTSSSLLESLLGKSPVLDADPGGGADFFTSSLLDSLAGFPAPGGFAGPGAGGKGGSLAKSVLTSLSKKLEDEDTHDDICRYLQSTNPVQVQSVARMAGLEVSSNAAERLADMAHKITPKTIRRTVKLTKVGFWGFQLTRKTMALLSKYRHLVFLAFLLQWTKSAILRPVPVPKLKAPKRGGGQPAPKAAPRNTPGGPIPNTPPLPQQHQPQDQQAGGKKPLTPGLLTRGAGGGLAALAAAQ